jgi:tetratricopeptide (TPR) repeat protein
MKTKCIFCCLLVFVFSRPALSCINKSGTKYGGGSGSYFGWRGLESALNRNLKEDGVEMEANLHGSTNFNDRSDYSVALMFLGRNTEAIELLERLEQEQPGQYFIAANLGTAYELSGNNAEALKWINEGIKRNPKDHEGTEWLHTRILEAKIARDKDAKYFEKHSVLELQPEKIGEQITIGEKKMTPKELAAAIQYQLGERLQFVKSPDPAVASLLFDYAAIEAATKSMESAKHILKMAADYGYPMTKVSALDSEFDRRIMSAKTKSYIGFGVIGTAVIGCLVLLYKVQRNRYGHSSIRAFATTVCVMLLGLLLVAMFL